MPEPTTETETTKVPDSLAPSGLIGPDPDGGFYGPIYAVPDESWMVRQAHGDAWVWKHQLRRNSESEVVQARRRNFERGEVVHYPHGATMVVLAEAYGTVLWVVPQDAQTAERVFTAPIAEIELGPQPESDPAGGN